MKKTIVGEGDLGDFRQRLAHSLTEYQDEFGTDPKFLQISREDTSAFLRLDVKEYANIVGRSEHDAGTDVSDFVLNGVEALRRRWPQLMGIRTVWDYDDHTAYVNYLEIKVAKDVTVSGSAPRKILILYFSKEKTRDDHRPIIGDNTDNVLGYLRVEECFGAYLRTALDFAIPIGDETVLNTVFARE